MNSITHIALLRGVNVGGHKMVAMSDLRELVAALGFGEPRTLLQSGNVVFRAPRTSGARLERLLETEAARRLGLESDVYVRTVKEWGEVVRLNPFRAEAERDPARLIVLFLRNAVDPRALKTLQAAITGPELVRAAGKHAYFVYPDGFGRSRLTPALIEKTLGRGTARNWNTVRKLAALAEP